MAEIRSDSRLHEGLSILFEMVGKEDKEKKYMKIGRGKCGKVMIKI